MCSVSCKPLVVGGKSKTRPHGRPRFNTLKNQGYNFEHNYGHGQKHLATVLAYLMLIAFTIDQLIQRCSHVFGQLWQAAKTKAKLWQTFRALFMVKPLQNFHDLYQQTALLLAVQVT